MAEAETDRHMLRLFGVAVMVMMMMVMLVFVVLVVEMLSL